MEISELENRLKKLTEDINKETFIYDLLLAYDFPKATISRIKSGDLDLSKHQDELLLKKKLLFRKIENTDPHYIIDELANNKDVIQHDPRFIVVTDFITFLSLDTKTKDSLDIKINEISKHFDFFYPWIGKEKTKLQNENIADIKAATKLGQLYDLILQDNPELISCKENKHALNLFFARLLFCLFAEDTGIFEDSLFINSLATHSSEDGSDLQKFFESLFISLDIKDKSIVEIYLNRFPYVNGGLFESTALIPNFSRKSRSIIIEAGQLDWGDINPDIFGSMVQVIADPEERSDFGVHYTSVINILKVINPLFMDEFRSLINEYKSEKDLTSVLQRIYSLKIFDPACGSGNFLIVTYKELSKLEIQIFSELQKLNPAKWNFAISGIRLNQFHGITINDFDAEMAKLSLWLSEHQMNLEFKSVFGESKPSLPLTESGKIVCQNSLRYEWELLCRREGDEEIYIVGNPPYQGKSMQTDSQKDDMDLIFKGVKNYKSLDYISCWFKKGSEFIYKNNCELAFVSTNSVTQGEQVSMMWPLVLDIDIDISFAYRSFKWRNNARFNAGVSVVIIGLKSKSIKKEKYLFENNTRTKAKNINAYLIDYKNIIIEKRAVALSSFPPMDCGNNPVDGGNLILSQDQKDKLIKENPECEKFILKYMGANEFINNQIRYCLWIENADLIKARKVPEINRRIESNKLFRENSKNKSSQILNKKPHQFRDFYTTKKHSLVISETGSERRTYLPVGVIDNTTIAGNTLRVVYDSDIWVMSVLSTKLHMIWIKALAGRMKDDIRYSNTLCYNTFPFPEISEKQKDILRDFAFKLIDIREQYSDKTISQLYDPEKMPSDLLVAHVKIDNYIDEIYEFKAGLEDSNKLEALFKLYENMTLSKGQRCLIL
jgi:hypothetical protein